MTHVNPRHDNLQDPWAAIRYHMTGLAEHQANIGFRFELFLLGDGEKKITEQVFTGMSNTSDFTLHKEDHTLGNLLSEHLKKAPHVMMAGYKVGHPNVPEVLLRVQTDGTITPREALVEVCKQLVATLGQLGREFQKEFAFRQIADQGNQGNANGGASGN
ncbi:RBP11-like subunits of RNA polymerase [Phialemonium atrogriseum]|uniref:RBP11-like subunits of RNA polymerase n=1 Tax=Phialemonium atrogriseum TaxID=1093897 RepID=A0AAJ0FPS0_9PEZI|nr:RBP11-like subunits of RNA polymerase [Phialemonium atrogriseum]KAK1770459.1 RBP11-like subunits of RNA polymerase [Phialemonium atrogriseum]